MNELEKKAKAIKLKFSDKLYQEGLKRGFLMSSLGEYEKCINFNRSQLNQLLQEDQDMWSTNVNESDQRAKLAQNRI